LGRWLASQWSHCIGSAHEDRFHRVGQHGRAAARNLQRAGSQLWVHERFREAAERYGDGAGEMTVCKVIEDDAGVELRVEGEWLAPWEVKHPSDT